jgi:glutamate carboxypeptidase
MTPRSRAEIFLKKLVDSPSPTSRQNEVRIAHSLLALELQSLGFQISWKQDPSGKTADLLIAERPGRKTGDQAYITFVSHIDTVLGAEDSGAIREIVRIDDKGQSRDFLLGAGIIDNKGGLAILVESLRLLFEQNPTTELGLRVVSSPDEENGSSAWHKDFQEIGNRSCAALGFEPALDDGSIISSRRGNRWYDVDIAGKEAHAGRCRGEELNAAHEAASLISKLLQKRDLLRAKFASPPGLGISIQVGHIAGGRDRHNIVCGNVHFKLDTRFSSFEQRDQLHASIVEILNSPSEKNLQLQSSAISYNVVDDCPPFSSESIQIHRDLVSELCLEISAQEKHFRDNSSPVLPILSVQAGGAGDVNHMSRPGLLVLDGLGPIGGKMHTVDEFLLRECLTSRSRALANWYPKLLASLSGNRN